MANNSNRKLNRREFLRRSAVAAAGFGTGLATRSVYAGKKGRAGAGKKVIVIGIDGMDPGLSERMMNAGRLPNFARLRQVGGYRMLGTSIPPVSPVAWANFINGAGPGSHGIFDFIHRNPERQYAPFYGAAEPLPGEGYWETGNHRLQLDFWPFNHKPATTVLRRQGTPFWDYLDRAGIYSTFYDLPSNYPASPSKYGHHRCLSGMGAVDMLGTYGTYQHYAEDGPVRTKEEGGGRRSMLFFEGDTAKAELIGPNNTMLKKPKPATIEFLVHRDTQANAAVIEIQKHKILLQQGQWSRWLKLDFELSMPALIPDQRLTGICRFYLQEISPNFRLYVTPVNSAPSDSYLKLTEPPEFIEQISEKLGLFYTTGFQEDHKALTNKVFTDAEFAFQAGIVLEERLKLLNYALENYDDGLLFFYFSSTDLQAHMFWWDSQDAHPSRSAAEAKEYFAHLRKIYEKMDEVVGDILKRYGNQATIIVLSDHGFANFERQFNLNTWLKENGYIQPADCRSLLSDVIWSGTKAYGLGMNGLYLNLKGRERDGIVEPSQEREELLEDLITKLEAVRDTNGKTVIRTVRRADKVHLGPATRLAPDLIVGYTRGYRVAWSSILGDMSDQVLLDNDSAWGAD
ncbi:MAG: alkaline phosphatase family protein, partial [Planctomycetota bacterium]